MNWQGQQAKARFGELLDRTLKEGLQRVTRQGIPVAVMIRVEEYWRQCARGKSLKALLAAAPLEGVKIKCSRDTGRTITRRTV